MLKSILTIEAVVCRFSGNSSEVERRDLCPHWPPVGWGCKLNLTDKLTGLFAASVAVVKSRDMHWGLLAQKDHKDISFASLRLLLIADGANPCE